MITVVYFDYLIQGYTHYGYRVRYYALKGYIDSMAAWVHTHTGRDIRLETISTVLQHLWQPHPMIKIIYDNTKH